MTARSGPDHVPVNLSARQARRLGLMMSGISGLTGIGSSSSIALKLSLESRLRALTAWDGPTLYRLTWKRRVTPAGLSIPALRASGHTTSGKGSTSRPRLTDLPQCQATPIPSGDLAGWSTASARDHKDTAGMAETGINPDGSERSRTDQLPRQAALAGWGTPVANPANGTPEGFQERKRRQQARGVAMGDTVTDIQMQAHLAGWPTCTATDARKQGQVSPRPGMMGLSETAPLCGWPTSRATDAEKNVRTAQGPDRESARKGGPQDQAQAAHLAGWPTPMVPKGGRVLTEDQLLTGKRADGSKVQIALENATMLATTSSPCRLTATGAMLTGCSAGMESGGQLDPAMSRWLMRIPPVWDECAPKTKPKRKK